MRSFRSILAHADSSTGMLSCVAFIGLNILDGCLTGVALELGSYELNPLLYPTLGSDIVFKWLISSAIVLTLVLWRRGGLLKPLNFAMFLVCGWNVLAIWTWI